MTPGGKGRFPGYDVLGQASHWDQETAVVVQARLAARPAPVFFTEDEQPTARALLDRLLANEVEPRLPLLEAVDARLQAGLTDGWHHDHLPPDGPTWRLSLAALDEHSRQSCGPAFAELGRTDQIGILDAIRVAEKLDELDAAAIWSLWLRYGCAAFYSHPWAWNEIGFGGPAYPRGYKNISIDRREPWEVREAALPIPSPGPNASRPPAAANSGTVTGESGQRPKPQSISVVAAGSRNPGPYPLAAAGGDASLRRRRGG